ncbi:MAG TPA: D-ribose pyranase [Rhodothermales bacterium]
MKKIGTLNRNLSRIIASMGHSDHLVVCDSGLPIPKEAEVVDLAVTTNVPGFIQVLEVILQELEVESAVIATEMESRNHAAFEAVQKMLEGKQLEAVPHEQFKSLLMNGQNVWFVRTGEATPFANVILQSGVTFK